MLRRCVRPLTLLAAATAVVSLTTPARAVDTSSTAANPAPATVPALGSWSGGHGTYRLPATVSVHAGAAFAADARATFVPQLTQLTHRPVRLTSGRGDITLVRDTTRRDLGAEGYVLRVGDGVTVTAANVDGAFYGTRTLLQLARRATAWPRGTAVDVPKYRERGAGVCACYIHFSLPFFQRLLSDMSYLKLNQLQLELKVKSARYPQANSWGYYTPAEITRLQALADRYHVTLVPEVNSPGHIDPWITNIPSLQLVNADGVRQPNRLDITKPAAFTFLTSLIDDYFRVFRTPYWHLGADEYMLGSDYADYPQIAAYAKKHIGPNAVPQDVFVDFVNRIDAYVRAKGKQLRMWNDGVTAAATIPLNRDITVEHWLGSGVKPSELLAAGHPVENAAYSMYLVRGGFQMDTASLYGQGFDPTFFEGERVAPNPGILGAKISVWPDNQSAGTENEVEQTMVDPLRFVAQITWGEPNPDPTYAAFQQRSASVGHSPDWSVAGRQPVPGGTYTLMTGDGRGADTYGGAAVLSGSPDRWTLTPTADGYYTMRAPDGRCAYVATPAGLGAPLRTGTAVTLTTCSADDRPQRWQISAVRGGFAIRNALSELGVVAGPKGTLAQQAPDVVTPLVWHLRAA